MVVTRRHPIYAAVSLMAFFLSVSGIYYLIGAPFVAVMQVLIYVGAILVLFLFIIMLIDVRSGKEGPLGGTAFSFPVALFTAALVVLLSGAVLVPMSEAGWAPSGGGSVREIAHNMYRNHAVSVELVSVLLLASMVGAVALVFRRPRFLGETGATAADEGVRPATMLSEDEEESEEPEEVAA